MTFLGIICERRSSLTFFSTSRRFMDASICLIFSISAFILSSNSFECEMLAKRESLEKLCTGKSLMHKPNRWVLVVCHKKKWCNFWHNSLLIRPVLLLCYGFWCYNIMYWLHRATMRGKTGRTAVLPGFWEIEGIGSDLVCQKSTLAALIICLFLYIVQFLGPGKKSTSMRLL